VRRDEIDHRFVHSCVDCQSVSASSSPASGRPRRPQLLAWPAPVMDDESHGEVHVSDQYLTRVELARGYHY
jgi:hypothetical protein